MKITQNSVPSSVGEITTIRLENRQGAWVELSSLGAGIIGVGVPDRDGVIANVALSYANPADYMADGPCMGKCPGRYANRIAGGRLPIGENVYQLDCNLPPNHLHGGNTGFQNRLWTPRVVDDGVEFTYISDDGEEGYPGLLQVLIRYRWSDDCRLSIEFVASTNMETAVNLTNHSYWNLRGSDAGKALDHELQIKASRWLPTDETLVPTGSLDPVEGTPMDFRTFKTLAQDIEADFPALKYGKGYDNCWALDDWHPGEMVEDAATLRDPKSGRMVAIDSDQPGLQVYTGNWLAGSPLNHSGRPYEDYDGVAIEMQGFPDAPNQPGFPSQSVTPDAPYRRVITFKFSTF